MVLRGEQIQRYGQAGCSLLSAGSLSNNIAWLHPCRACRRTSTHLSDLPASRCLPADMFHMPCARRRRPGDPIVRTTTLLSPWDVRGGALSGRYTFESDRTNSHYQQASTCHSSSSNNQTEILARPPARLCDCGLPMLGGGRFGRTLPRPGRQKHKNDIRNEATNRHVDLSNEGEKAHGTRTRVVHTRAGDLCQESIGES